MTWPGQELVDQLRSTEAFRALARDFALATGLPLALVSPFGVARSESSAPGTNAFCQRVQGSEACRMCDEVRRHAVQHAGDATQTLACPAGLAEAFVPLRVGREIVGFLQTGQVFLHKPDERGFERMCRWLARRRVPFDRARLRTTYFGARRLDARRFEAMVGLLQHGAETLGRQAELLQREREDGFSPAVVRACRHIRQNLGEALTLADTARAAGLSRHHFCKVFHQETGLAFREFVARLRAERAAQLLRKPHSRVAEVALEVGFQSISQFNRVFRRIYGQSPTEFRLGMPPGALAGARGVAAGR